MAQRYWSRRARLGLAKLSDPLEYENGRRREFWTVMRERAAAGDGDARHVLDLRADFDELRAERAD